jgi:hypothetical protein
VKGVRAVLETAWAIFEKRGPPKTSRKPRKGRKRRNDTATPGFSLSEAISIEGIVCHETEMKRFVGIRRIIQYVVDTTARPAREALKLAKNAVVSLVCKGILEASKDSDGLTARGKKRCKIGQEKRCGVRPGEEMCGWRRRREGQRLRGGDGRTGGEDVGGDRGEKGFGMKCRLAVKSATMGNWAIAVK